MGSPLIQAKKPTEDVDALIEPYLEKIYSGEWDSEQVIGEVYEKTSKELLSGFEKGYSKAFFGADWTTKDNRLLNRIQNNIFAFSGAKSYSEAKELRDAVYENGRLLGKADFKRRARMIDQTYNENYLEAERELVMKSGAEGSRWLDIEDSIDTHPYLEYVTMRDSHVRPEHSALDGIILSVDDPFWNSYYPPNGYRCRCTTRKRTEREYTRRQENGTPPVDSEEAQKRAGQVIAKPFRHNVGKSEIFERDGHPYFKASREAREMQLSAVKHYGMKPVKDIYQKEDRLSVYKGSIQDIEEYNRYWQSLEEKYGKTGDGFTMVDRKNNISAHFDEKLKQKLINRERFGYFDEAERILKNPDEVWTTWQSSNVYGKEFFNVYIRYYSDNPVVVLINMDGRVDSFYRLDSISGCEQFRTGLLKNKR